MAVADRASTVVAFSRKHLDRLVPPKLRSQAWKRTHSFAVEKPLLFAFLVLQIIPALLPVALFLSFTISTILFATIVALIFVIFWIDVAGLILVPTLLIVSVLGVCIWAWGVATFMGLRWMWHRLPENMRIILARKPEEIEPQPTESGKQVKLEPMETRKGFEPLVGPAVRIA